MELRNEKEWLPIEIMTNLTQRLGKAYILRLTQDIEPCFFETLSLKSELNIAEANSQNLESQPSFREADENSKSMMLECLLIEGSLLRARNSLSACKNWISDLDRISATLKLEPRTPLLTLEKGLNHFAAGEYFAAATEFSRLLNLPIEKSNLSICGALNLLFCQENLNIPTEGTLKRVLELIENGEEGMIKSSARQEIELFAARRNWRSGEFAALAKRGRELKSGQGKYFFSWLCALPYHALYKCSNNIEELTNSAQHLYLKDYRAATLIGVLGPDDFNLPKPSDFVDRLYLWVWRWLTSPEQFPFGRIYELLKNSQLQKVICALTVEDQLMLSNSLRWIKLFSQSFPAEWDIVLNNLPSKMRDFSLLAYESLLLDWLFAVKTQKHALAGDIKKFIVGHAHHTNDQIFLGLLYEHLTAERLYKSTCSDANKLLTVQLQPLLDSLSSIVCHPGNREATVEVDLSINTIRVKDAETISSKPLSFAIYALKNAGAVPLYELCEKAFGLHTYDSYTHSSKVYNLVSRLKKIFPATTFKIRDGNLIADGDWTGVSIRELSMLETQSKVAFKKTASEPLECSTNYRSSRVIQKAPRVTPSQWLNRKQVDELLNCSRSTAQRVLRDWIEDGLVKVRGKARSTKYQISKKALESMV
jgi:hypothetical protein